MNETKLRDVIEGAMADAQLGEVVTAEVVERLMRRLGKAENVELDDGTLFVRREHLSASHPFFTLGTGVCMTCGLGRLGTRHSNVPESLVDDA